VTRAKSAPAARPSEAATLFSRTALPPSLSLRRVLYTLSRPSIPTDWLACWLACWSTGLLAVMTGLLTDSGDEGEERASREAKRGGDAVLEDCLPSHSLSGDTTPCRMTGVTLHTGLYPASRPCSTHRRVLPHLLTGLVADWLAGSHDWLADGFR